MNFTADSPDLWRRCSSCKKPILFRAKYWVCNVSTCNRKRTGLAFCDVSCWDAHVPMMNHRDSWAEERKAPSREEWAKILSGEDKTEKKQLKKELVPTPDNPPPSQSSAPKVILRRSKSE